MYWRFMASEEKCFHCIFHWICCEWWKNFQLNKLVVGILFPFVDCSMFRRCHISDCRFFPLAISNKYEEIENVATVMKHDKERLRWQGEVVTRLNSPSATRFTGKCLKIDKSQNRWRGGKFCVKVESEIKGKTKRSSIFLNCHLTFNSEAFLLRKQIKANENYQRFIVSEKLISQ